MISNQRFLYSNIEQKYDIGSYWPYGQLGIIYFEILDGNQIYISKMFSVMTGLSKDDKMDINLDISKIIEQFNVQVPLLNETM